MLVLVAALYMPAGSYAAVKADSGIEVTFRDAYGAGWSAFGRYLWMMILMMLYVFVPILLVGTVVGGGIVIAFHGARVVPGSSLPFLLLPIIFLLYLCILVYSIYIMLRFALAFPAGVEENLTAWAAMKRSTQLTRGAKGRIFLVMLVIYAAIYAAELVCILVGGIIVALGALVGFFAHVAAGSPVFFVLVGLGALVFLVLFFALISLSYAAVNSVFAVIYHDQRLRKDGLAPAAQQAG